MPETHNRSVEAHLRAAVESAPSGLLMTDSEGRIVLVNREIERMFGYAREELLGQPVERLVPTRLRDAHPGFRAGFGREPRIRSMGAGRDLHGVRKDGTEVPVEIGLTPLATEEGMFVLGAVVDISERKRLEGEQRDLSERLRQAQKMEAIGTLAGGVAHDFNNILGAIIGYAELIGVAARDVPSVGGDVRALTDAAVRGRKLVERILAFSRRQEASRTPIDLADVVREVQQLLRASLPAGITISVKVAEPLARVLADGTSVHQVLMNLTSNAAQAMPRGGEMAIDVAPLYVRDSIARAHPDLREGPYVSLSVRDSGMGMDAATRERAFEPFFTTKPLGAGTGLGLAMVHGIMHDHQGAVQLESEVGHGTVVRCLFPSIEAPEPAISPARERADLSGNGARVLFVDDEESLLAVGQRRLELLEYRVTTAALPTRALEILRAATEPFDLVITDLSMPGMSGLDLAEAISVAWPTLPVMLLTGHADGRAGTAIDAGLVRRVLQKPVLMEELGEACRDVLRAERPKS
jgi:PAS domain S-box-containing protein